MAMKKVDLSLQIVADLRDSETGKVEKVPFKGAMNFEYNGVSYEDALKIQGSLMQAISEHGQRMLQLGIDRTAKK